MLVLSSFSGMIVDEIARLLRIEPAQVRARVLAGVRALGSMLPRTGAATGVLAAHSADTSR